MGLPFQREFFLYVMEMPDGSAHQGGIAVDARVLEGGLSDLESGIDPGWLVVNLEAGIERVDRCPVVVVMDQRAHEGTS